MVPLAKGWMAEGARDGMGRRTGIRAFAWSVFLWISVCFLGGRSREQQVVK